MASVLAPMYQLLGKGHTLEMGYSRKVFQCSKGPADINAIHSHRNPSSSWYWHLVFRLWSKGCLSPQGARQLRETH